LSKQLYFDGYISLLAVFLRFLSIKTLFKEIPKDSKGGFVFLCINLSFLLFVLLKCKSNVLGCRIHLLSLTLKNLLFIKYSRTSQRLTEYLFSQKSPTPPHQRSRILSLKSISSDRHLLSALNKKNLEL
jgi:hypothetical protein